VKRVSIPSNGTPGKQRKEKQKKRWFKKLQKWRTGCEGRISVRKLSASLHDTAQP
jgi:IS5 family transposase